MKKILTACFLLFIFLLDACAPVSTATPTEIPVVSPVPSQTGTALPVTPVESAYAPGDPTAAPLEEIVASHTVNFETPDGATINGELYGSGKTAVIFSVMGNCKPGWRDLAQLTGAQGLMALTYQWRDCGPAGPVSDEQLINNFVNNARGAISFVRDQGAENIILAGASLGGIASAKLAVESEAIGLIIFASPSKIPNYDFSITASDLNVNVPKLFITAENDMVVPADKSRKMYELAAEPKEWQSYPGTAHGTDVFKTESGREAQEQILAFILSIAKSP